MVSSFQKRNLPLGGAILIGAFLVLAFSKAYQGQPPSVSSHVVGDYAFDDDKGSKRLPIDGESYCLTPVSLHLTAGISQPSSARPLSRGFLVQDLVVTLRHLLI